MEHNQEFNQPLNSLSLISSMTSVFDSTSKQSNMSTDRIKRRNRSFRKRYSKQYRSVEKKNSSYSTTTTATTTNRTSSTSFDTEREDESLGKSSKIHKQEARPLGTCVRKCSQCRRLKHILLAECTVCSRMMDIDLKDCKCQMHINGNSMNHFICSTCNSELTLDGYIICANRTCQTLLSALINKEDTNDIQEKIFLSSTLTNISYPKPTYRTVAIQINTLINLPPLQRFLSTILDEENKKSSSSLSWSKQDYNRTIISSSDPVDTSPLSMDSGVDASLNNIAKNMVVGFNSNQPTKLALQSEDESQQKQQSNLNDTTSNDRSEFYATPKSPRCLSMMKARKRRDRLSTLLPLQTNQLCQTQLSCLTDANETIRNEDLSSGIAIQTSNPNKIERQIQVDTIRDQSDDSYQVQSDTPENTDNDLPKNLINDDSILRAITDRDSKRWSGFIDQISHEHTGSSPSEMAQQLLDAIERLHSDRKLNNLTTDQLQQKVRQAMCHLRHMDAQSYLQNSLKITKTKHSERRSKRTSDCNGQVDLAVTVRQIDKRHCNQSTSRTNQNWKPYVDRLFEQGHSAEEIRHLLHEAARSSALNEDRRLQDVYDYIKIKANNDEASTVSSGIQFFTNTKDRKLPTHHPDESTNLSQPEKKIVTDNISPDNNEKCQDPSAKMLKDIFDPSKTDLNQSVPIKSDIIQVELSNKTLVIDLNEDEKESNSVVKSSSDQEYEESIKSLSISPIEQKQSTNSSEILIQTESTKDMFDKTENQELIEPKTSQINETIMSPDKKDLSNITVVSMNKSKDKLLTNLGENGLQSPEGVTNALDNRLNSHSSDVNFNINQLINKFESELSGSNDVNQDNIQLLMNQYIKDLKKKDKKSIGEPFEKVSIQKQNQKISDSIHLVQEHRKVTIPIKADNKDSVFNQHVSEITKIQTDSSSNVVPIQNIEKNTEAISETQLSSTVALDSKQQGNQLKHQETTDVIRCRGILSTSSNEQKSVDSLHQILIGSTQYISSKSKSSDEEFIANQSHLINVEKVSSKIEDDTINDRLQDKKHDSSRSEMSSNRSSTSDSSDTSQKDDEQDKVEPSASMITKEEQILHPDNRSPSSVSNHQEITNIPKASTDSLSVPYETTMIQLEQEHAIPIVVPDKNVSLFEQIFHIVQAKILSTMPTTPSKQTLKSDDQKAPVANRKSTDNSPMKSLELDPNLDDTSQQSFSNIASPNNTVDNEKQSISSHSVGNNSLKQTDQSRTDQDLTSSKSSVASSGSSAEDKFETPQKELKTRSSERLSPSLVSEHTPLSNTDITTSSETSIKNTDQSEAQVMNKSVSVVAVASKMSTSQKQIEQKQLPVISQRLSTSNSVQSKSVITELNDSDDTVSSKKSISAQKDDNEKSAEENSDEMMDNEFYTPTLLSPNKNVEYEATNTVLSPSRIPKIEFGGYEKLNTPSSFSTKSTSSTPNNTPETDQIENKRLSVTHVIIEEPSEATTPVLEEPRTSNDNNAGSEKLNQSSPPNAAPKIPFSDISEKISTDKFSTNEDKLEDTATVAVTKPTDVLKQESILSNDHSRPPFSPMKSNKNSTTSTEDNGQSKTPLSMNEKSSTSNANPANSQISSQATSRTSIRSTQSENNTHTISENTIPNQNNIEEKSSSDENSRNTMTENDDVAEHSIGKSDVSAANLSIYSSNQSKQKEQEDNHSSQRKKSARLESLIKLLPSPPDQRSLESHSTETDSISDEDNSSYLIEDQKKYQGQIDDRKPVYDEQHLSPLIFGSVTERITSSSTMVTKTHSATSNITTVLPSSAKKINKEPQKYQSQLSSVENKSSKLPLKRTSSITSEGTKKTVIPSSFNLTALTDINSHDSNEKKDKKTYSQISMKSLSNDRRPIKTKQPSSSSSSSTTNPTLRDKSLTSSIPKILTKRSSIKQTLPIIQSTKSDLSTSSNNTVTTDQLQTTHSTISDQQPILPSKQPYKRTRPKDELVSATKPISKRSSLRKTSRSTESHSLISTNRKEPRIETSKTKSSSSRALPDAELGFDALPASEGWTKSQLDISQLSLTDKSNEENILPIHERPRRKKLNRKRIRDGSRAVHQDTTVDSSRLPIIEPLNEENHVKKPPNNPLHRSVIRLPVTQIERFECGTIGPYLHPCSVAHQILSLPSINEHQQLSSDINQTTESFTDRLYSLISSEDDQDKQAFESIVNWQCQQHQLPRIEEDKFRYIYLLNTSIDSSVRGKQYPIVADEIDMIDDPNACTIVNEWAFADLVKSERKKIQSNTTTESTTMPKRRLNSNKHIQIILRKRPLTEFEENILKEVDIISIADPRTVLLHIPSITVDNQVFIKNRKFKCDQTFDADTPIDTMYQTTLYPLIDKAINGNKCLCFIGGGKYSGKTYLLRSLIDFFALDLIKLLSTYDIYIKLFGICHNRIIDILQNYSPIRLIKSMNWTVIPNNEFHIENERDLDCVMNQIKKRRRFLHQLIEIDFRDTQQSKTIGSLMIIILASSQYVYTRSLCSHRRKFLINSLNKTILSFKRTLIGLRQNPDQIRTAFNNDILTRLIQPYVFDDQSYIYYIGTLNPGHRHRIATKSTLEFARNLRFCLRRIRKHHRRRRQQRERLRLSRIDRDDDELYEDIL